MLEGLLGRGPFHSKCKSLIKATRTRIEAISRRRNATIKIRRKDIADLMASGLEDNAYARAGGLVVELVIASCYDYVGYICEIVLKHLSIMQKTRECPEDCREAVASLMYAAARFSDLPELYVLTSIFRDRYGNPPQYHVNQKLVENMTRKPPSAQKKLQLLQEIATEFSIPWDSRDFVLRMRNPTASQKVQSKVHGRKQVNERNELNYQNRGRHDVLDTGHQKHVGRQGVALNEMTSNISKQPYQAEIYLKKKVQDKPTLSRQTSNGSFAHKNSERSKANVRSVLPHPYVNPRKNNKPRASIDLKHLDESIVEQIHSRHRLHNNELHNMLERIRGDGNCTIVYYRDDKVGVPVLRRRSSIRRRHSKSASCGDDNGNAKEVQKEEEASVARRISRSRRRGESMKGTQIVFNGDKCKMNDEEEKMIDRLLLHYSHKSRMEKPQGARRHFTAEYVDARVPTPIDVRNRTKMVATSVYQPTRSGYATPQQSTQSVPKKVLSRSASFQRRMLNPAKHVHPYLSDYDIATLKRNKSRCHS